MANGNQSNKNQSWSDQLKVAGGFLSKIAFCTGSLEQCRLEWGKLYEKAKKEGLMTDTAQEILKALEPTATKMQSCEDNIRGKDKATMKKMIVGLSGLANKTISADGTWNTQYAEGRREVEGEMQKATKESNYGDFNDFNVQASIIGYMIDVADAVNYFIKKIRNEYDRFSFTAEQQFFMKQYSNELDKMAKDRMIEFNDILSKLERTKDELTSIFLKLYS